MFIRLQRLPRFVSAMVLGAIICLIALGCNQTDSRNQVITVFAASSLTDAFQDIAREFESRNPGTEVKLNFAGSQRLRSQMELGAEADVFASANEEQMAMAREAGLVDGAGLNFASSTMAVIASRDSSVLSLSDLATPGTRLVLAHESVPAGHYSRMLLERLSNADSGLGEDYTDRVLANLVSEETTVKFVEQKVVLGQADAGIVYRPGMLTATSGGSAREVPLPAIAKAVSALYPISVMKETSRPQLANSFVDFVLSQGSQGVLASYGFGPP